MEINANQSFFLTGTGTGVGKTHAAAAILYRCRDRALSYWKPVQTGDDDDRSTVKNISGLSDERILPVSLRFREALSPHRAAELENRVVDTAFLLSEYGSHCASSPLLIEGAGGLLVPLNRKQTWLDFIREARLNVILAAWSGLGTINHCLLTIGALRSAGVPLAGIIFCGPDNPDNRRTVLEFSQVPDLGWFNYTGNIDADSASVQVASLFRVDTPAFPSN